MIRETGAYPEALDSLSARNTLNNRARTLALIRQYFAKRQVIEVETPLLGRYPVTDPQLDNLRVQNPGTDADNSAEWLYLQTSPEYAMKKLLSLGSGSIYQIAKAFRQDAPGRLHSTEFTLLEWYRLGFNMDELIDDVSALVVAIIGPLPVEKLSYRDAFIRFVEIDPFLASIEQLKSLVRQKIDVSFDDDDKDLWLDLLLTHWVEPQLGRKRLTFLFDYPASQAALARIEENRDGYQVAKRFELYINGIELANGYHELADPQEQIGRFQVDNQRRIALGKSPQPIDREFLEALHRGLPDCAGVALGVDRLMLLV